MHFSAAFEPGILSFLSDPAALQAGVFFLGISQTWDTGARSHLGKEEEEEAEEGQAAVEEVVGAEHGEVVAVVAPQVEGLAEEAVDRDPPRERIRVAEPRFHRQSAACGVRPAV